MADDLLPLLVSRAEAIQLLSVMRRVTKLRGDGVTNNPDAITIAWPRTQTPSLPPMPASGGISLVPVYPVNTRHCGGVYKGWLAGWSSPGTNWTTTDKMDGAFWESKVPVVLDGTGAKIEITLINPVEFNVTTHALTAMLGSLDTAGQGPPYAAYPIGTNDSAGFAEYVIIGGIFARTGC